MNWKPIQNTSRMDRLASEAEDITVKLKAWFGGVYCCVCFSGVSPPAGGCETRRTGTRRTQRQAWVTPASLAEEHFWFGPRMLTGRVPP